MLYIKREMIVKEARLSEHLDRIGMQGDFPMPKVVVGYFIDSWRPYCMHFLHLDTAASGEDIQT